MTATTQEKTFDPRNVDFEGFAREVAALRREIRASLGEEDIAHLKKMERWGKAFSVIGYATAGIAPNPVSAVCLALGRSTRWMLMHHIGHKGYDQVPGIPEKYTSKVFAMGSRRFLDWPEWMVPEAWNYEHNVLHHSFTGELKDPDLVERNMKVFHDLGLPRVAAYGAFAVYALSWKFSYYAPNTLRTWLHRREKQGTPSESPSDLQVTWKQLFKHCYGPYGALAFGVVPALYLPFGVGAWASALTNMVAAEAIANVHTFIVIGPNHAGDDLYRFDDKPASRAEGYVRQVIGSANYATGDDVTDFAHLWLNYQIEHHLFPELPMRQYQLVQPKLKALCEKYGIPYVQESVWKRAKKMLDIFVGKSKMMRSPSAPWVENEAIAAE